MMKPRVVPASRREGVSPTNLRLHAGKGRQMAVWDVRTTHDVLGLKRRTNPAEFSARPMLGEALALATKLVGEGVDNVQVEITGISRAVVSGQPKIFVCFNHEGQVLQLCSTHFVSKEAEMATN